MATKIIADTFFPPSSFQPIKDVLNRIVLECSGSTYDAYQRQVQRYSLDDDTVELMSSYEATTAICTVLETAFIHTPIAKGLWSSLLPVSIIYRSRNVATKKKDFKACICSYCLSVQDVNFISSYPLLVDASNVLSDFLSGGFCVIFRGQPGSPRT